MAKKNRLENAMVALYHELKKANAELMAGRKAEAMAYKKEAFRIRCKITEMEHSARWESDANGYVYALYLDNRVRPETASL